MCLKSIKLIKITTRRKEKINKEKKPEPKPRYLELGFAVATIIFAAFAALTIGASAEKVGLDGYELLGILINLLMIAWGTWYYRKNRIIPGGY